MSSEAAKKKRKRDEVEAEAIEVGEEESQGSDEQAFTLIDDLQSAGISVADITKLKQAGYTTVQDVSYTTMRVLMRVKGITDTKASRILLECKKRMPSAITTAADVAEKQDKMTRITTGSKELDKLLGGGIQTHSITEVSAEFGTGKSQLCFQACVTCQLPKSQGGGEGKAFYIDTEGTFSGKRIRQIATRYGLDPEAVLNNITYARAHNSDEQTELLQEASRMFCDDKYALVIVDSSMGLYRLDYVGRGELQPRQAHLGRFLLKLEQMTSTFGVAALITNQVTACPDGASMFGPQSKPIGGHVMGHAATTRLQFRKARGENRKCKINDSPDLPGEQCEFRIYEGGIGDVE